MLFSENLLDGIHADLSKALCPIPPASSGELLAFHLRVGGCGADRPQRPLRHVRRLSAPPPVSCTPVRAATAHRG